MNPNEPPKDHVEGGGPDESSDYESTDYDSGSDYEASSDAAAGHGFERNIRNRATWQRLLYMLVFALIFNLGIAVACVVVVLQFFWVLFTGETKPEFTTVGRSIAEYTRQILLFMSFNTEERPFPFGRDWPSV